MSSKDFSLLSTSGHCVQLSGIIREVLVEDLMRNICVKLFLI